MDVRRPSELPVHPLIEFITASSTDPETVEHVRSSIPDGGTVLAILDADHDRDHVLAELRLYAPMVTPGSYCIVEDTNLTAIR